MNAQSNDVRLEQSFIWVTRGKEWGFRFLRTANRPNPLQVYEDAFSGIENTTEVFRRSEKSVALRFLDPEGRRDAAGRVIPHEFVVFAPLSDELNSVKDGLKKVWPRVANEFARAWDHPHP